MVQKKGKVETKKKGKKNIDETVVENVQESNTVVDNEENTALDENVLEATTEVESNVVENTTEEASETVEKEEVIEAIDEIEEIHNEALANTFKENNFSRRELGNMFGYSWNGQEVDF